MRSKQKEPETENISKTGKNNRRNPLTCIHDAYTLSVPQETNTNEAEGLMVSHFLETLAEVTISVASRQVK